MLACGVGAFEKQGRTCALWAGIAPADQLSALHRKVDHALTVPGLSAKSRAYVPHIALARLARLQAAGPMIAAYLAHHAGLRSPAYAFTRMTLFESHLGHGGAHYEAVGSWPFG
ncbi:MAG: RNA 2',3'-cyclic phosphodiesterase [Sphingomonas sp.]